MEQIPDEPILRCMERSGYPPWMRGTDDYDKRADRARGEECHGEQ